MKTSGDSLDKANHLCHSTAMPAFAVSRSTSYPGSLLSRRRGSAALNGRYGSPALSSMLNAQRILLVCKRACVVAEVCRAFRR
jgi:hypothetical protein